MRGAGVPCADHLLAVRHPGGQDRPPPQVTGAHTTEYISPQRRPGHLDPAARRAGAPDGHRLGPDTGARATVQVHGRITPELTLMFL